MEFKLKQRGGLAAAAGLFLGLGCTTVAGATGMSSDHFVRNAADDEQVNFSLSLPYPDEAGLEAFNEDLYNPSSPNFHKFLSSSEFDARFAPTQAQYENLKSLAKQYGFTITRERDSHTLLDVSGSAATIRSVFGTQMQHRMNEAGKDYVIGASEAVEPFPLSAVGIHAVGLNARPAHPRLKNSHKVAEPQADAPRAGSQPSGLYSPADLKTAYNLNGIQNGGMPVALVEFSGATYADAATYASKFGLNNPDIVLKDVGHHTTSSSATAEVMLDIEMVEAIENPKTIYVYTAANNSNDGPVYQQIADDNLVAAMSSSWGECEAFAGRTEMKAENTAFLKMVSEGMAAFIAAGDDGASGCLSPLNGDSSIDAGSPDGPNVTVVGGTSLNTSSSQGWVSEAMWNDAMTSAGGGGISSKWTIPSYQKNVVFNGPSGQYSTTMRNDPDVSLDADPNTGVYIYDSYGSQGGWQGVGGTSDAAPQYAAFWGLVSKGLGKDAGFANPTLYALAGNATSYARDFHDITCGNNNYYNAYTGFDDASGWGSYNGGNLYADAIAYVKNGTLPSGGSGGSSSSMCSGGTAPAIPSGLTATASTVDGSITVDVSWNATPGAIKYYLYVGTSPGGETPYPYGAIIGTGESGSGNANTTYYYKVQAWNTYGYSAMSNEVSVKTP
jgi:kumamolisin